MTTQTVARVVVVDQISYVAPVGPFTLPDTRFGLEIQSDEQPYQRHYKVGTEWESLDFGWVQDATMVVVQNRVGEQRQVIPTQSELQSERWHVVEVAFDGIVADLLIAPGRHAALTLAHMRLNVRCPAGEAKVTVTVFPR